MSTFTAREIEYLHSRPPARLATVGSDGRPRVKPLGFLLDTDTAQLVVDDVAAVIA